MSKKEKSANDTASRGITRRDFLNGVVMGTGASLLKGSLPPEQFLAAAILDEPRPEQAPDYPPAKMGMRGNHDGSFTMAHRMRDGASAETLGEPEDTGGKV